MRQKQAKRSAAGGRGRLGRLKPLLGTWHASSTSSMGKVSCTRTFTEVLGGKYIHLSAKWKLGTRVYEESAYYGVARDGQLSFWSFTSDGKQSQGRAVDAPGFGEGAIGFEAEMPAGTARMVYWPEDGGGWGWAVEAKNAKGWRRFTEHHYRRA